MGRCRTTARVAALASALLFSACASHLPGVPANVSVGPNALGLPAPLARSNGAAPQMLAMRFSSLDVARGTNWTGRFATSTNVASVEVRTNLFSIDVPRIDYGIFAFTVDVLDVPPIFLRDYRLRVIARNAAGDVTEEDLPLRFR